MLLITSVRGGGRMYFDESKAPRLIILVFHDFRLDASLLEIHGNYVALKVGPQAGVSSVCRESADKNLYRPCTVGTTAES